MPNPDKHAEAWARRQAWANEPENRKLLIIIADPETDELHVGFNRYTGFVRFPPGADKTKGVVWNVLQASNFKRAIDPFMTGLINALGVEPGDDRNANELYNTVGGTIMNIGKAAAADRSKLEVINTRKHGKKR